MSDQRQIHNPSSSSTDPNPPMAIEPAATAPPAEDIVPSKLTKSREKVPKSEAGLVQARFVANLIDGFQQVRAAHRAQQQHDRRLPMEDQASAAAAPDSSSASAAAAPKSKSASAAPRGRASSRTPPSRLPEQKAGQLIMTDVSKRGRSSTRTTAQGRDETPDVPLEGTVSISDIANKRAKRTPQEIMRNHYKENRRHFRTKKKITLPISKRRPT